MDRLAGRLVLTENKAYFGQSVSQSVEPSVAILVYIWQYGTDEYQAVTVRYYACTIINYLGKLDKTKKKW